MTDVKPEDVLALTDEMQRLGRENSELVDKAAKADVLSRLAHAEVRLSEARVHELSYRLGVLLGAGTQSGDTDKRIQLELAADHVDDLQAELTEIENRIQTGDRDQ